MLLSGRSGSQVDPTARTAKLHGRDLCYLDRGAGPVVLFIHGLLGSQRSWRHLVDELDDHYRIIAPDLLGHGASAKPTGDYSLSAHAAALRDLLDHLGVERATLVGHSLGGGIAMQFCYLFPGRVEGLVLIASGGLGREVSPLLRSATWPGAEWVLPLLASANVHRSVEAGARVLHRAGWRPTAMLVEGWRGFRSLGVADSRRAFLATARAVIDPGGQTVLAADFAPVLAQVPTLIVWGADDRIIPLAHGRAAHRFISNSELEIFEQAGHFPHLDQPVRFARLLSAFMRGLTPSRTQPSARPTLTRQRLPH